MTLDTTGVLHLPEITRHRNHFAVEMDRGISELWNRYGLVILVWNL